MGEIMNLDSTQTNAVPAKQLFDPSEEWFRVARRPEPDLAVDGLRHASVLERMLRLFGRRKT
jgi:hypothetical protein